LGTIKKKAQNTEGGGESGGQLFSEKKEESRNGCVQELKGDYLRRRVVRLKIKNVKPLIKKERGTNAKRDGIDK